MNHQAYMWLAMKESELTSLNLVYKSGFSHSSYWKKGQGKTGERTRWLNSPNVYQKVEVLETGTNDPKKITKVEYLRVEAE